MQELRGAQKGLERGSEGWTGARSRGAEEKSVEALAGSPKQAQKLLEAGGRAPEKQL